MSDKPTDRVTTSPVTAKVHQGYNLNMKINIVGTKDIPIGRLLKGCQPRQGAPRRDADALDLPPATRATLLAANREVMAWLARDNANAQAFLADPVAALLKAGVKLDRADQKTLVRARAEIAATAEVVTPGLQLRSLSVAANPNGRVKRVEGATDDCGCGTKGREK